MPQTSKFSSQQLRGVFMTYAQGETAFDASMKAIDFKDKFFPGIHWQRNLPTDLTSEHGSRKPGGTAPSESGVSDARTASIHVDHILAGMKPDEVLKAGNILSEGTSRDKMMRDKEMKYMPGANMMGVIKEDKFEAKSQSS
jgi:hypothetical protein